MGIFYTGCLVLLSKFCYAALNSQPEEINPQFSLMERLFRVAYFRIAVINAGWLEKYAYQLYLGCAYGTCSPPIFDPERADKSLAIFKNLGAQEQFVIPEDHQANIHMITLKAADIENSIQLRGGRWERLRVRLGDEVKEVFAIIPPEDSRAEKWESFEKDLLNKIGWKRKEVLTEEGGVLSILITSENADLISDTQMYKKVFLFCHSSSTSFTHDRNRAGYYLGMKQNVVFFDNRGIYKSTGNASEEGFYLDAIRVFNEFTKEGSYKPTDIWVGGKCSGAVVAAAVKTHFHSLGIHFFAENSFTNTRRDFVSNLDLLSQYGYDYLHSAMRSRSPLHVVEENEFNIESLWQHLPDNRRSGKVVLIHAINDQRLAPDTLSEFRTIAERVSNSVDCILFKAKSEDPHADDVLAYPEVRRGFTASVFKGVK